jgi:hypothetical protein
VGAGPDLDVASVTYGYDGAIACGSDHALVTADATFTDSSTRRRPRWVWVAAVG